MENKNVYLAIDLGGSKYMVGIIDEDARIVSKERYMWKSMSPEAVVEQIFEAADGLLSQYQGKEITAVGMTIPGIADPTKGIWKSASFMGIYNLPIAQIVGDRYALPVFIDNDTKACALAEKSFGSGRNCNDFLYMTVSNGIGSALFLDGKLYYGAHGYASEIGQCVVVENGRKYDDGLKGSAELYASGRGIARTYAELSDKSCVDDVAVDGKAIAQMARAGDKIAIKVFELEGYYLGKIIASACNILDPEKVIIGGGLSLAFDLYEKALTDTVAREFVQGKKGLLKIEPTILGYDGALIGAAAVAMRGKM